MEDFGEELRKVRLAAGYGLRQFAKMIGELPSNLSAIERGNRPPWRSKEKLRDVANALALEEGSVEWQKFFLVSLRPDSLPNDIERMLSRGLNLVLLRTVDAKELTDEQLLDLIDHVKKETKHGRKRSRRGTN